jgi:hypothetical protein
VAIADDIRRRDGAKCCISGLAEDPRDPLVVVRIFPSVGRPLGLGPGDAGPSRLGDPVSLFQASEMGLHCSGYCPEEAEAVS